MQGFKISSIYQLSFHEMISHSLKPSSMILTLGTTLVRHAAHDYIGTENVAKLEKHMVTPDTEFLY